MTLIDRYLLFLFARVLLLCFVSMAGLLVVVHLFTNLDDFIEYGKQQGGLGVVFLDYYGPYVLNLFERLSGLMTLMAMLFVIAWIYRTNEFTALLAAGITKERVVRPLLIASIVVLSAAAISRELLIPRYQDQLDRKLQDLTGDVARPIKPTYDRQSGILISGRHLIPARMEIFDPSLRLPPALGKYGRQVLAHIGHYRSATVDRPAGYLLSGIISPEGLENGEDIMLGKRPLIMTSQKHPWILPNQIFVASDIDYESLQGGNSWKQYASTAELVTRLRKRSTPFSSDVQVKVHSRILQPFMDFTLLLLGLPVVLSRPDRHLFWVAGACLALVGGFMGVVLTLQAIGASGYFLTPAVACWIPLIVCAPWAWMRARGSMNT